MSNSLSLRDQNSLTSALNNLFNNSDNRIHKKDLTTLVTLLSKCSSVEASNILMDKKNPLPNDSAGLEKKFIQLYDKLVGQKSGMHDAKEAKLKIIQEKLSPVVKNIHLTEIKDQINELKSEHTAVSKELNDEMHALETIKKTVSARDEKIKQLENENKSLVVELDTTSEVQFSAKDIQRKVETEAKINELKAKYATSIKAATSNIEKEQGTRGRLLKFAHSYGANVEADLTLADAGAIYKYRTSDLGRGKTVTWRDHMSSETYAMEKFGHIKKEGHHTYSDLIKEPNMTGHNWLKLMDKYIESPAKIRDMKIERYKLVNERKGEIEKIESANNISTKEMIHHKIATNEFEIGMLENRKSTDLMGVGVAQLNVAHLQEKQKSLATQISMMEAKLKSSS